MGRRPHIYPHLNLWKNLGEVERLLEIHAKTAGKKPGRKYGVAVLNKSAIVLLVACWEAFVEDLAEDAFSIFLRRAKSHNAFSNKVLADAAKPLKDSNNPADLWKLAGDGWKIVLRHHRVAIFHRFTGKLNTPRPAQVDALYESLLGIKRLSDSWHWNRMSADAARTKLDQLVELRGSIAHRVASSRKVLKKDVKDHIDFVNQIAVETSNSVRSTLLQATGKEPWPDFTYKRELPS